MKKSFTYYIILLIIRLNGIKKIFSKDPINFRKIRKGNVHHPVGLFFKKNQLAKFKVSDTLVTEIGMNANSNKLLIFIHGGAFISGPAKHHWTAVKKIAKRTDYRVWMCDYPKAPESKIEQMAANIDQVYEAALAKYLPGQISFIGDSAGGTLVTGLIQRLIKNNSTLPQKIILLSPVFDASMSNPKIELVEDSDPMLSKIGVLSAKKMCLINDDLKNRIISPLYGSFEKFPKTILFLAENDITFPDQKLAVRKMNDAKIDLKVFIGENMPHIWPLLPVMKEAKKSFDQIIDILNN